MRMFTAEAPVNIAVIKYWGKRNEDLILPINDSISVTLSKNKMCAKTTVACSEKFEKDKIWLNGKEQDIENLRLKNCIQAIKMMSKLPGYVDYPLHICSENNFPTAAGLASSAAGYACLVKALGAVYEVDGNLSTIARQGSGSASRSMYGGFVQWKAGVREDGIDSISYQLASKDHWPQMRVIILVVNASKKETPSTKGMKQSVLTSSLLQYRVSHVVPSRVERITEAILKKDFPTFAEITMKDSNQFHAVCLDTYPPIHYLTPVSYKIIELIHAYNTYYRTNKVAYTFDAGPNACLFLLEESVPEVLSIFKMAFPPSETETDYIRGLDYSHFDVSEDLLHAMKIASQPGALHYIINTQVGNGPIIIQDENKHLLDQNGLPKRF